MKNVKMRGNMGKGRKGQERYEKEMRREERIKRKGQKRERR